MGVLVKLSLSNSFVQGKPMNCGPWNLASETSNATLSCGVQRISIRWTV